MDEPGGGAQQRPRLNLKPRDEHAAKKAEQERQQKISHNPFGDAKPREQVLATRTGKSEEEILKDAIKHERLRLRLNATQLEEKQQLEDLVAEVKSQLTSDTAAADQQGLQLLLKEREAAVDALMDKFAAASLEAAQKGEVMRPSERRMQQLQQQGAGQYGAQGGQQSGGYAMAGGRGGGFGYGYEPSGGAGGYQRRRQEGGGGRGFPGYQERPDRAGSGGYSNLERGGSSGYRGSTDLEGGAGDSGARYNREPEARYNREPEASGGSYRGRGRGRGGQDRQPDGFDDVLPGFPGGAPASGQAAGADDLPDTDHHHRAWEQAGQDRY